MKKDTFTWMLTKLISISTLISSTLAIMRFDRNETYGLRKNRIDYYGGGQYHYFDPKYSEWYLTSEANIIYLYEKKISKNSDYVFSNQYKIPKKEAVSTWSKIRSIKYQGTRFVFENFQISYRSKNNY